MHLTSRALHVSLVILPVLAGIACGGGSGSDGGSSAARVITADGSSTVLPSPRPSLRSSRSANPGTRVTVGISGTGGGFQKFCRDETDISDASRPITPPRPRRARRPASSYIELPVAYDGLAVVVHPKNTWAASMTVAELKKLWEPAAQGKIMRWSQIRAGWPDREIHLFGAGVDSGTFDYFTEAIVGKTKASRGDYTSSEDDNVIVQGVERRRGRARLLRLRVLRGEPGQAQARRD